MSNSDNSSSNIGSSLPLSGGLPATTARPERTSKIDWPSDAISEGEPAWYCGDTYPPLAYLAGRMSGLPDFGFGQFNEAAARYRAMGWTVHNPAEAHGGRTDLPHEQYMFTGILSLLQCSHIVMLPGWEQSYGAQVEKLVAEATGKCVMYDEVTE